jgi:16S rRNA (uracil1498-N3)-methyltransferase
MTVGETTLLGDGRGHLARATVTAISPSEVACRIDSSSVEPHPVPQVWLAQALAKGDRDEAAIQAATELGVDGVIPYAANRSISQWRGDKIDKGIARWTKIVTEASKQAIRSWVPHVAPLVDTTGLVALVPDYEVVVLDPQASEQLSDYRPSAGLPVLIVVGPEGGLDDHEIAALVASGATTRRLGATVLRTSSAGPAALAVINVALGRW